MTGLEYVKAALRLCGVLDGMETPKGEEGDDALNALNRMMRSWSAELGPISSRKLITFTLTSGTFRYTIGNTTYDDDPLTQDDIAYWRPQQILEAHVRVDGVDNRLEIVTFQEYQRIASKDPGDSIPYVLGYNPSTPSGVIYLYPPPGGAYSLRLTLLAPFKEFALATDTGDTLSSGIDVAGAISKTNMEESLDYFFPPGYDHAIVTNLAELLGAEYGIPMTRLAVIQGMAQKAKASIVNGNLEVEALELDPRLPNSRSRTSFSDFQSGF